jgi:putative transposase
VSEAQAKERFVEFCERWGERYPAVRQLWENSWNEFVPFLDYDLEVRRVVCSTNAIESLHARMRRATRARGHFPNEQAAMKCSCLVVRSLDPAGRGSERWMNRWKPALNAFAITFDGRLFRKINDNRRSHLDRYLDSPIQRGILGVFQKLLGEVLSSDQNRRIEAACRRGSR